MKSVKSIRRANHHQIAKLTPGETRLILDLATKHQDVMPGSYIGTYFVGDCVLQNAHIFEFPEPVNPPVAVNHAQVGTTVRPEGATIVNGVETVESFLARGGTIKVAKPTKVVQPTIRVKGSRNLANTMLKGARTIKSIEPETV